MEWFFEQTKMADRRINNEDAGILSDVNWVYFHLRQTWIHVQLDLYLVYVSERSFCSMEWYAENKWHTVALLMYYIYMKFER